MIDWFLYFNLQLNNQEHLNKFYQVLLKSRTVTKTIKVHSSSFEINVCSSFYCEYLYKHITLRTEKIEQTEKN